MVWFVFNTFKLAIEWQVGISLTSKKCKKDTKIATKATL